MPQSERCAGEGRTPFPATVGPVTVTADEACELVEDAGDGQPGCPAPSGRLLGLGVAPREGAGLARDSYVFHSLRHGCASALLAAGAPVPAVAGHLGDVRETVMRTYAHWPRDDRSLPAAILDRMMAGTSTELSV
jgi:hypothetical protein